MDSFYTRTVYQNNLIQADTINNYKSIKARDSIKSGELLLIEHDKLKNIIGKYMETPE